VEIKMKKIINKISMLFKRKRMIPITKIVHQMNLLDGKVALIIGGTGGIGFEIGKTLALEGCKIILVGSSQSKIDLCKAQFPETSSIHYLKFNVLDFEKIPAFLFEAINVYGKINILICSCGTHTEKADFLKVTPEEYSRVMDVNLKGTYFLAQGVAKYMISSNIHGRLLFLSSVRGDEPAWSPYGISKWGLNGMIKGLAMELSKYQITVNGIAPGTTATNLIGYQDGDTIFSDDNSSQRMVMPVEISNIATILTCDVGEMINGEIIHISGGRGTFEYH
jgi:NAD(P)-dependent dehydrogenase (short-subunit alcohol dehydrogenase family)